MAWHSSHLEFLRLWKHKNDPPAVWQSVETRHHPLQQVLYLFNRRITTLQKYLVTSSKRQLALTSGIGIKGTFSASCSLIWACHFRNVRWFSPCIFLIILHFPCTSADSQYNTAIINTNVIVSYTGEITWLSHGMFKSSCNISVEYFPFDIQDCRLKWASWTFDGYAVRQSW